MTINGQEVLQKTGPPMVQGPDGQQTEQATPPTPPTIQNNAPPQRAMISISAKKSVRRCLFPDTHLQHEAQVDNSSNMLKESIARDQAEKKKKYNFDFETETPLPGPYEWYHKRDGENWIRFEEDTKVCDEDSFQMKAENEATPKTHTNKVPALVRKRKSDTTADSEAKMLKVKKKIIY